MCGCDGFCEYWPDIATFALIFVTGAVGISNKVSKSSIFLFRIGFGFLFDIGALITAAIKYGFNFKKENSNEYNPLPLILFIIFIFSWSAFFCLLLWYVCKHRKDEDNEIKQNNKYQLVLCVSKCIGLICSTVLLSLSVNDGPNYNPTTAPRTTVGFIQATTLESTLFEKYGVVDGLLILYAVGDMFLNFIEICITPFKCCKNCKARSRSVHPAPP